MQDKDINIHVELDDNDNVTSIEWNATDLEGQSIAQCRAMLLSMWDHESQDTMRLNLWTKDMTIEEMKVFYHQTMVAMADTLETSTNEKAMVEDMRDFIAYFGDKMEVYEK